jgi:3-hydroxy-D-aspartate aldolase
MIERMETPILALDMDLFEANIKAMRELSLSSGVALRPHYKTHKCPQIAVWQIEAGAVGICCAKLGEAEDLVKSGIKDVLIANQVVNQAKIARLAHLALGARLGVCVDDEKNIHDLEKAAALAGSNIYCLVEYDVGQRRCGVETKEEFLRLAKTIASSPHLVYEGANAYAGHLAHIKDSSARQAASAEVDAKVAGLKSFMAENGMPCRTVSGVSTGTSGFKGKGVFTEMQVGSYVFMDGAYEALKLGFNNSLFVMSEVISTKKDRVVTDAGMKCIGSDMGPPQLKGEPGVSVSLSEEHAKAEIPGHSYNIGDKVFFIPSHCCTTVNLHNKIYMFRRGEVEGVLDITSRGKSQ